ncbi:MAG: hypothetical protein HC924_17745 [Synechococcaceae cyanobacterium SM2_3_2]|nr:hypothetical protein [Synechococcaceae cyanobacterium SM2_3_2]
MTIESQPAGLQPRGCLSFLYLGILLSCLGSGLAPAFAQPADPDAPDAAEETEETFDIGLAFSPAIQSRVNRELVSICGGFRCEDYRRVVRVAIQPEDSLEQLTERLKVGMLAEVERTFAAANSPERVVVEGYVFRGSDIFTTVEVPLLVMFVPRHRWVVERFSIEDDAILYPELIRQVESALGNLVPPSAAAVPSEALPPLPPPPPPPVEPPPEPPAEESSESEGDSEEDAGAPEGATQREPVDSP